MSMRVVTPPATEIVTLAEAKKHCRVEYHDDDDAYLQSLISAATAYLDGPYGIMGRAIIEQQMELTINGFPKVTSNNPSGKLAIQMPTLISVDSVEYTTSDGSVVPFTGYRVFGVGSTFGGHVLPAIGEDWPSTTNEPSSVKITFTAGFSSVPSPIKHAVLLLVSGWFESRETVSLDRPKDLPFSVDALLAPFRNWA